MSDTPPSLADATEVVVAAELAGAQALLEKLTAFKADTTAILATLPSASGYTSPVRQLGQTLLSNLSMMVGNQLPSLIASFQPATPAA